MALTSFAFLAFTAVLLALYYTVPGRNQWRVLLAASWLFYLWAGVRYWGYLLFTTVTSYLAARKIDSNGREAGKKNRLWLAACLTANFVMLFVCKLRLLDGALLPLGVSFYIFQTAGYVTDVYRGTVKAERSLLRFALFTAYFPTMVQGPICKFSQLSPQLLQAHPWDGKQVSFGLQRMLWGYFKKLVIADRIAVAVAALRAPEYTGLSFLVLTVFYAVQIYGDFTGGMDIALGLSQTLGITLPENFRHPFFSRNIAQYWQRWHITLGGWMKEYVFYPVSVSTPLRRLNRAARARFGKFGRRLPVYAASAVTWLATGIWHGLTPNFALWGMLNWLVIVVSGELEPLYARFHRRFGWKGKGWYPGFEMLRTFLLMNLIRACDLFADTGAYFFRLGSIFSSFYVPFGALGLTGLYYGILAAGTALMLAVSLAQERWGSLRERLWKGKPLVRYGLTFGLFLTVLLMGCYGVGYEASYFIYNQF